MRILGCVVVFLVGCGGGSDSPSEKCDDLIDLVCDRAVECVPSSGTHAECVTAIEAQIPCDQADSVSENYNRCLMQLRSTSCGSLFPGDQLELPADCNSVILVGRQETNDLPFGPTSRALEFIDEP